MKEDKQVFADGRVRHRHYPWSVAEKMYKKEEVVQAVFRALKEELNIDDANTQFTGENSNTTEALSFPGLMTTYDNFVYQVVLEPADFRKDGYREVKDKLTTYFIWEPAK